MPVGHETESENVLRRAATAVGDNPAGTLSMAPLAEQIASLPPEAGALKRILERDAVRSISEQKMLFDEAAVESRRTYDRTWLLILLLIAVATAIGMGALVTPGVLMKGLGTSKIQSEWLATALIYICLVTTLVLAWRMASRRIYETWCEKRGAAEILRRRFFETSMMAEEPSEPRELPLLPLKLEHFRRYQLDVQEAYFADRAARNRGAANLAKSLILPCVAIIVLWLILLVSELASAASEQGPLPSFVPALVYQASAQLQKVGSQYIDIYGLLLGVLLLIIYGAAFIVTTLSSNLRNAARFAHARDNMAYLRRVGLEEARQAAVRGEEAKVVNYVSRVHSVMTAESSEWVRLMELDAGLPLPQAAHVA